MAERFFTADYVERTELRDGTRVMLRLQTPDDRHSLRHGFEKLSAQSRYARFLAPKNTLTEKELDYLCNIDQETHFALGAFVEDLDDSGNPVGAGVARFIRLLDEHAMADAAIAVSDEMQGRGLGKLLWLRLCAAAAERGIERFRCELLGSNTSMAALIERVSPERSIEVANGVMVIDMLLPNVTPTEPPSVVQPEGGMYALLRLAAENAIEWTEAVRKLWRRD